MSDLEQFLGRTGDYLEAVRHFAQEDLGCGCPDTVFEQVRVLTGDAAPGESNLAIVIGERLLVVFANLAEITPLERNLSRLLLSGVTYRDSAGLNRFRLVLAGELTDDDKALVEREVLQHDERVHVHLMC